MALGTAPLGTLPLGTTSGSAPPPANQVDLSSVAFSVVSQSPQAALRGEIGSRAVSFLAQDLQTALRASLAAVAANVSPQALQASLVSGLGAVTFNAQGEPINVGGNALDLDAAVFTAQGVSFDSFLSAPLGVSSFNAVATDIDFPAANQIILTNVLFNTAAEDYQQALGASLGTTTVLVSSTEFTNTLRATLTNTVVKWTAHALDIPFVLSLDDLTLNDVIAVKLAALGFTGSINDKLLQFFLANGATTNKLRDAEKEWLLTKTAAKASVVDMYEDYFDSLGFVGNINEKMKAFFKSL